MAKAEGVCVLRGAFVNGKVKIVEHSTDFPPVHPDALPAVKTGTAKGGELKVDGLDVGQSYWACQEVDGEWRCRTFAAHAPEVYKETKGTKTQYTGEIPSGYANNSIEGARSTSAVPKAHGPSKNPEKAPYHDVADVKGGKLSDTAMGSGHPAVPDEEVPAKSQEKAKGKQLSDTPKGEVAPTPDETPTQSDVGKKTPQRSATPEGEATPVPKEELPKPKRARKRGNAKGKSSARKSPSKASAATSSKKSPARSSAARKRGK